MAPPPGQPPPGQGPPGGGPPGQGPPGGGPPGMPIEMTGSNTLVIIVVSVFLSLSWASVILRLWTRVYLLKSAGRDDVVLFFALILFSIMCASNIIIGEVVKNHDFLNLAEMNTAYTWLLVAQHLYISTMVVLKVALGLLYLRILIEPWQKKVTWIAIGTATLYSIAYFFSNLFRCGYFHSISEFMMKNRRGQCASETQVLGLTYTFTAITALTDLVLVALPLTVLGKTKMRNKEKITLAFILSLGMASSVASVVRFKFIPSITAPTSSFFNTAKELGLWSVAEPAFGIIAGSLATLRPLSRRVLGVTRSLRLPWTPSRTCQGTGSDTSTSTKVGSLSQDMPSCLEKEGKEPAIEMTFLESDSSGSSMVDVEMSEGPMIWPVGLVGTTFTECKRADT